MDKMTKEQNYAVSYINGDISYVIEAIKNNEITYMALCDELFDMLSDTDFKLFLTRMKGEL